MKAAVHVAIVGVGLCSLGSEIGGRGMNSVGNELETSMSKTVHTSHGRESSTELVVLSVESSNYGSGRSLRILRSFPNQKVIAAASSRYI